MSDLPKSIKRMLREQVGIAHEKELRQALLPLADAFARWKQGELDSFDLSQLIHEFHDGAARDIWKRYNYGQPTMAVAYAVHDGILNRGDLPPSLLEHLRGPLELCRDLARIEAEADTEEEDEG